MLPGVAEALQRLSESDVEVTFVTNNSTRSPSSAAEKIAGLTGVEIDSSQVATSSQSAARLLLAEDGPVMCVGEEGVRAAVLDAGFETTDDPDLARSVVVGLTWDFGFDDLARASAAVRRGARFVATNTDPTYPTETGLLPGAGALVSAIATASERQPEVAGKPNRAMVDLLASREIEEAWVVGDRIDTDVALGSMVPAWSSILVLSGVTDEGEDLSAADKVVDDFAAAVEFILSETP